MGVLHRFGVGWRLTKGSIRLLLERPGLLLFPTASGILAVAVFVAWFVSGSYLEGFLGLRGGIAYLLGGYFGILYVGVFFNAALMYTAGELFRGRDPRLREGLVAAWQHKLSLLVWTLVAGTVGLLLGLLETRRSPVTRLVGGFLDTAWTLATYLIVPAIVFEGAGPLSMFQRSADLFTSTWGRAYGAGLGVKLTERVLIVVGVVAAFHVGIVVSLALDDPALGTDVGYLLAAASIPVVFLFTTALGSIARTALYVFAEEGEAPEHYSIVALNQTY